MSRLFSYNPCANVQFSGFLIPLHLLANIYPNIPAASAQQHAKPPKRSVLPGLRRDLMWLRTWVMGRVLAALAMGQLQQHSGFLSVGSAFFGFMRSQIESKRYFKPIGSMYGIYANIWGILMVNVTIYGIHTDPMGYNTHNPYFHDRRTYQWNSRCFSHNCWEKHTQKKRTCSQYSMAGPSRILDNPT